MTAVLHLVSCVALIFVIIYVSLDNLNGFFHHHSSPAGHAAAGAAVEHSRRKKRGLMHPHELVKVARDKISKIARDKISKIHNAHHHVVHPHDIVKTTELDQFPTLQESFKKSKLVGLYFGASWCKECTMATEAIQKAFDNSPALSPSSSEEGKPYPLSIVFVSSHHSDYTEDQYKNYGSTKWQRVPFNSEEQTKLKQHFHACAEREAEELHVDRKYKVPHLIILDSETRGALTTLGVQEVLDHGYDALAHWQTLQKEIVVPQISIK